MRPTLAYVVGTSDCGSTLLAFILASHPMICSVGEPPKRAIRRRGTSFGCSCGVTVGQCPFWQALFKQLAAEGIPFSDSSWPNDFHYLNDLPNRFLGRYQYSATRRAMQRLAGSLLPPHRRKLELGARASVAFVRTVLAQTQKAVFLDSSKDLFRLEQLLPIDAWDFKVIRMVRDVRWFVYTKRGRLGVEEAARHWRAYQLAADRQLAAVADADQLLVRYEDLCFEPAASARRIHQFLGVKSCDPPVLYDPAAHHILGDGIGDPFTISTAEPWRTEVPAAAQRVATSIAGDVNRRFGYA